MDGWTGGGIDEDWINVPTYFGMVTSHAYLAPTTKDASSRK